MVTVVKKKRRSDQDDVGAYDKTQKKRKKKTYIQHTVRTKLVSVPFLVLLLAKK